MAEKETVLVTGGAGMIGSELISLLLPTYRVISLDNYFIGNKENHIAGAEYIEGHTKDIEQLLGKENPKIIFHLGEYSRVEQSFTDLELVWQSNVLGTHYVLEYWRKRGCKLVYAGSSTKFADGGMGRDQSPYAWMKASNTELVRNYGNWFSLPYAITYFYNAYGPREATDTQYGTVIGIFKMLYKAGKPITVRAPGTQKRNFTHVHDLARGLQLVGEKGHGDEYGLGAPESYSILDIAKMFTDNITMLPERPGNRMDSIVDTTKAEKEFGWKTEHTIKEYIDSIKGEAR
ncbi:MAG TPA: NAD-dependent epimerase/dehydratase family protein [Candidatus Paceibacterota bacterium]|nr:NAD-dependent epimerase/dehydratase family protein [Candidatus Paceibacterota bacterium]